MTSVAKRSVRRTLCAHKILLLIDHVAARVWDHAAIAPVRFESDAGFEYGRR